MRTLQIRLSEREAAAINDMLSLLEEEFSAME